MPIAVRRDADAVRPHELKADGMTITAPLLAPPIRPLRSVAANESGLAGRVAVIPSSEELA
jgi:hypothetical protein